MGKGAEAAGSSQLPGFDSAPQASAVGDSLVLVGTYTDPTVLAHTPKGARGEGVHALRLNSATGKLTPLATNTLNGACNPAFLVQHPSKPSVLYASTECIDKEGELLTLTLRSGGVLDVVSRTSAHGKSTCYVNVHHSSEYMLAVNYWDAKVTTLPLHPLSGCVRDEPTEVLMQPAARYVADSHPDRSEHWEFRQRWPHSHCIVTEPFTKKYHFVSDLGQDKIFVYSLCMVQGRLACHAEIALPKGKGPRHLLFHPQCRAAYIVNELDSTVTVLRYNHKDFGADAAPAIEDAADPAATLAHVETLSTLPEDYQGRGFTTPQGAWKAESHTSELRLSPDGNFLFIGNRGHNSIAIFAVDTARGGVLTPVDIVPSGGVCPRNFNFDATGRFLVVGNQDSNNLTVFAIDAERGTLSQTDQVHLPSPNYVFALDFLSTQAAAPGNAAPAAPPIVASPLAAGIKVTA